jgi:hypothetical protein
MTFFGRDTERLRQSKISHFSGQFSTPPHRIKQRMAFFFQFPEFSIGESAERYFGSGMDPYICIAFHAFVTSSVPVLSAIDCSVARIDDFAVAIGACFGDRIVVHFFHRSFTHQATD